MSGVGQSNPFSDASEYNTLAFIIARATDEMQTVSIVKVTAVDTGALTVDVQVLVNLMTGANISVPHGVISARPYYRAQGGTSGIILDPVVGDIGVMVFASRDSSAVISKKGLANPGSQRRFSWSDGIYFGGILNPTPTQYLKFAGGGITLLSPSAITIQSPDNTVSGPLEVTGIATFDTDVHILGDLYLTGVLHGSSAIFSGNVTAASFTGGGGGGGGTVTSVGISTPGSGVVVGGGPVTTSGTLTVDLSSTAYAALALAVTALQSISIATGTGLTGGPLTASGTTVSLSAATIASLLPASPAQGDIVYYDGSAWVNLAPGTAGYVLQTNGAGANPTWVAGGGGGGPANLEPQDHTSTPTFVANDEFESAAGTAIDTAGTRFTGATAWVWGNQGTSTALQTGDGSINLVPQVDGNLHGVYQPIAHAAPWKYRARLFLQNAVASAGDLGGVFAYNSSNGHSVTFGPFANTPGMLQIRFNSFTSFNSTGFNALPRNYTSQSIVTPVWYEMASDGTTLTFSVSSSGAEGSFIAVCTETIASFLGTIDNVGIIADSNSTPASSLICDLFRQYQ